MQVGGLRSGVQKDLSSREGQSLRRNLLGQLIPKQVTRSLGAFGHGRVALEPTPGDQAHETRAREVV